MIIIVAKLLKMKIATELCRNKNTSPLWPLCVSLQPYGMFDMPLGIQLPNGKLWGVYQFCQNSLAALATDASQPKILLDLHKEQYIYLLQPRQTF